MKTAGIDPAEIDASPRQTKFSLAANDDPDLVPALAKYPIDEVDGRFPKDGISSGRPHYTATPLLEADLRSHVRLLGQHGIAFNHLMNGACFGNRDRIAAKAVSVSPDYRTEVLQKFADVEESVIGGGPWGIRSVSREHARPNDHSLQTGARDPSEGRIP